MGHVNYEICIEHCFLAPWVYLCSTSLNIENDFIIKILYINVTKIIPDTTNYSDGHKSCTFSHDFFVAPLPQGGGPISELVDCVLVPKLPPQGGHKKIQKKNVQDFCLSL